MKKSIVLVVEKDRTLSAMAAGALREAGYEVFEAPDATDGLKKIFQTRPDLIIASTDLPPVNGENACLRLRQASYLPLIAIGSQEEVVEMLELGADAYVIRPPSNREVVARVHLLLNRQRKDQTGGGCRTGIMNYLRAVDDSDGLSPTEFRLSSCLLSNEGRLLDYPRLITEVWGEKMVSVDTLHFYIRRLRRKLDWFNIFGVRGVGYGLIGDN
jgi:two-component system, OmpR family, response regulator ArlR